MKIKFTIILCTLLTLFSFESQANEYKLLNKSFEFLRKSQPTRRYSRGTVNIALGALAVGRAQKINSKSIFPEKHKDYSKIMLAGGLSMLGAGLFDIFSKSQGEEALEYYDDNINGDTRIHLTSQKLKKSAQTAFWNRMFQATATAVTGYSYFFMWGSEFIEHKALVFPMSFLGGITLLNLLWKTPQEQAWDFYKYHKKIAKHRVITMNFDIIPVRGGIMNTIHVTF